MRRKRDANHVTISPHQSDHSDALGLDTLPRFYWIQPRLDISRSMLAEHFVLLASCLFPLVDIAPTALASRKALSPADAARAYSTLYALQA